ncbi:MAG: THUMP-like domain-containing protein [Phocaeicola sp.]
MQLSTETLQFIEAHANEDVRKLALQAKKQPGVEFAAAMTQIAGRQTAKTKLPTWYRTEGVYYPPHLSMEQCSSELTAAFKAELLQGENFADLTGGFGIDFTYLARGFKKIAYVERQEVLCQLAQHNFPLLGLPHATIHHQDGMDYLQQMEPVDCLFLDPARRDESGGKTVAISSCEPNIAEWETLLTTKAKRVLVKLSPMLDLSLALKELETVSKVYVVSVENECKELLLVLEATRKMEDEVTIHCVELKNNGQRITFSFIRHEERDAAQKLATQVESYLYEPYTSVLKAGAYKILTQNFDVKKLHTSSHLYTSTQLVSQFPGRKFRVTAVSSFGKRELKELLQDVEKANLTVRNFPSSVAELRKRMKLKEGGNDYIFATTLQNEQKVLIKTVKAE